MAPGSYLPARVRSQALLIRSSTTVWRKCTGIRPGRSAGRAKSDPAKLPLRPVRSQFKTPSASMNLNLNWRRKRTYRAAGIQTEAESKLPFHLFTPHVQFALHRSLITSTGCRCLPGTVRLYPSFRTEKGISENDLVKVFSCTGEVELRAKVTTNVPKILVMW